MSYEASDWVAALGPRLRGATKDVLWAGANRAGDGGEQGRKLLPGEQYLVTMGTRRWADEADVQRDHLRAILDKLVDHKVLEVALEGAGPRPTWYRFTLRDPDGLPKRFRFEPEPAPFDADSHARATAAREHLQRHIAAQDAPDLVARSDRATRDAAAAGASGTLSGASGTVSGPQWHGQTVPKPLTANPHLQVGGLAVGESNERGGQPASGPPLGEEGTTMPPGPAENGSGPGRVAHDGQSRGGDPPGRRPLAVALDGAGEDNPAQDADEPTQVGAAVDALAATGTAGGSG